MAECSSEGCLSLCGLGCQTQLGLQPVTVAFLTLLQLEVHLLFSL